MASGSAARWRRAVGERVRRVAGGGARAKLAASGSVRAAALREREREHRGLTGVEIRAEAIAGDGRSPRGRPETSKATTAANGRKDER